MWQRARQQVLRQPGERCRTGSGSRCCR